VNILALDLGTKTGFAFNTENSFCCGTWTLARAKEITAQHKTRMDRRSDIRAQRLFDIVRYQLDTYHIDAIVFEDVLFASSRMQTQLWSSLRTVVWLVARASGVNLIECVPTGTLKKFAGHGGATKEMMGKFLCARDTRFCRVGERNPKFFFRKGEAQLQEIDDNAIDAVWLHRWAQQNLCKA
jgi:Holliday junction resolvasome RuvABC endonuclease subunit